MRDTRLILVEGIMGSGKSTFTRWLARQIARAGVPVVRFVSGPDSKFGERNRLGFFSVAERLAPAGTRASPTDYFGKVLRSFPDQQRAWRHLRADVFQRRSERRWRTLVRRAAHRRDVGVFDGQWFGAELTAPLLLDQPKQVVEEHLHRLAEIAAPLYPVLIYLRPPYVEGTLRRVAAVRGDRWLRAQIALKVDSPYGQRRGLTGVSGWIEISRRIRELCDDIVEHVSIPTRRFEIVEGCWPRVEAETLDFLCLPRSPDPAFVAWHRLRRLTERTYASPPA